MDKQQIISFIEAQVSIGKISSSDLIAIANNGVYQPMQIATPTQQSAHLEATVENSRNMVNVFYAIGAIIVLVGAAILIGQYWNDIGFFGRISVTLGLSFVTYFSAFILNKPTQRILSEVMFTMSCGLAPVGIYVLLNEGGINYAWPYTMFTAIGLMLIYGFAYFATKRNILVLITIGFATWAYYTLLVHVFTFNYFDFEFLKWSTMLLGFSYILMGEGYKAAAVAVDPADEKEKKSISGLLLALGTFAILGSGIFIGGIFDLFYILFIFAAFYGSVYLKNRSMLMNGALFLMIHIGKLTSKYFADSIGWPVALMIVGFMVIGVGYMTYYLNKKYISGYTA